MVQAELRRAGLLTDLSQLTVLMAWGPEAGAQAPTIAKDTFLLEHLAKGPASAPALQNNSPLHKADRHTFSSWLWLCKVLACWSQLFSWADDAPPHAG